MKVATLSSGLFVARSNWRSFCCNRLRQARLVNKNEVGAEGSIYSVLVHTICAGGEVLADMGVCDDGRAGLFLCAVNCVFRGSTAGEASGGTFDDAEARVSEASLDV